jgi:hypothetical protein
MDWRTAVIKNSKKRQKIILWRRPVGTALQ